MPPERCAVEVSGLIMKYRGRAVVDGLSLEARAGAITAILGPNGAGKTTTVECCEGLRRPHAGTVRVLGLDPTRQGSQLRARVGVMLQDGGLPTGARAGELLDHVAALHSRPLATKEVLGWLGLTEHARTTVRRLSGGLKQRLALAIAIIGRPEVVFLDEPSSGLDPQSRLAVWALIERLRAGGAAVVMTTHLMDEAERLADHVVVVDAGRVVASGSPGQLTGDRGEVLRFSARPGLVLTLLTSALPTGVRAQEWQPGRYLVEGDTQSALDPGAIATVTAWCANEGVRPEGLTLSRRTLEDVFLDLTGRALR